MIALPKEDNPKGIKKDEMTKPHTKGIKKDEMTKPHSCEKVKGGNDTTKGQTIEESSQDKESGAL